MDRLYLIILAAIIVLFLLILFLTRINLRVNYRSVGKDFKFSLGFSIWKGLVAYKLEIPYVDANIKIDKPQEKGEARPGFLRFFWPPFKPAFKIKTEVERKGGRLIAEERIRVRLPGLSEEINILIKSLRLFTYYKTAIIYFFRKVNLRYLRWQTEIGANEPSQTGFLIGAAWGVKGFVLTLLNTLIPTLYSRPMITITPNFKKACLNTVLDLVLEVRGRHVFMAVFKVLLLRFKSKRN